MYPKSDSMQMVEEEDVEFIRLQFTDMFRQPMKNVAITTQSAGEGAGQSVVCLTALPLKALSGSRSPICICYPDLDSFTIFPWRPQQGKVARIICDVYRADGTPFRGRSASYVLLRP